MAETRILKTSGAARSGNHAGEDEPDQKAPKKARSNTKQIRKNANHRARVERNLKPDEEHERDLTGDLDGVHIDHRRWTNQRW